MKRKTSNKKEIFLAIVDFGLLCVVILFVVVLLLMAYVRVFGRG